MRTHLAADICEHAPGIGKSRIEADRAIEHFDCRGELEFTEAKGLVDGAKVELVCERMARDRRSGIGARVALARSERRENRIGESILQREQITHIAIDFRRMHGAAVAEFPDLHEDANARAHFLDAALGDEVDIQFAGDLRPIDALSGVSRGGGRGPHNQRRRRPQAIGHGVGESHGEKLFVGAGGAQLERDDGDGFPVVGPGDRDGDRRECDRFQRIGDFRRMGRALGRSFFQTLGNQTVESGR
jgi:hypothetical protein